MDAAKAREIAIREATKLAADDALPVCSGCPEGRFEGACKRWLKKLCKLMRHATFLEWRYATVGAPAVMFVLQAQQPGSDHPVLEVPIVRVDGALGPERQLAIIGPEADETRRSVPANLERDIAERDRIGEILEHQQTIIAALQSAHDRIDHLQRIIIQRDGAAREMLQRAILLVNHWGRAPYVGTVEGLLKDREIVLERPGQEPQQEPAK
jgi:hypothetical protein